MTKSDWPWLKKSNVILLDVWGVLTDGYTAYPEGLNLLHHLKKSHKDVFLLSNTSLLHKALEEKLIYQGYPRGLWKGIITAGDASRALLTQKFKHSFYYLVGDRRHERILDGTSLFSTSLIHKASFVLIASMPEDLHSYLAVIENPNEIPIYCADPDIKVTLKNGKSEYCAGKISNYLKNLGFPIEYIGKPYPEIYRYFFSKYPEYINSNPICIGDSLETDIMGANQHSFTSVLYINRHNQDLINSEMAEQISPHFILEAIHQDIL